MEKGRIVRTLEVGKKDRDEELVAELIRLEKRTFPKHESLAESFGQEIQRRNACVLYVVADNFESGNPSEKRSRGVAGYLMFSCTSLVASITKLAGSQTDENKGTIEKLSIAVSFGPGIPGFWKGYGETLLRAAIEKVRSKKVMCVSLHVDPLREPAFSLYRKLGFEVDTVVHSYYAPSRDAYRMVLTLASD